jgi:MFS family permease
VDDLEDADVFGTPGYLRLWTAETVSVFGSYVTGVALPVLVLLTLRGTAFDVGLVNAARWLPYLLLGLVVGALVDRRRRKPVLVVTDLGCGILLALIPLLWFAGVLTLPVLMVVVALCGAGTLVNDAAAMSFLPRVVPARSLLAANARLDQSASVAQTSGPVLAGALVSAFGPPVAILLDAFSYIVASVTIARIRVDEPMAEVAGPRPRLAPEIAEGLRWVYGHRVLGPLAVITHAWFLFNSMLNTVFVPFLLLGLHLTAFELGITLACAGAGGLIGSLLSTRVGTRWGAGRTVIACWGLMVLAWAIIAVVPAQREPLVVIGVAGLGQLLYGIALGGCNANEMGYRQQITPDALQARTNTTMRSFNRAAIVIGAPLGGLLADGLGYRPTLGIGVAGFALVTVALALSPFRTARHGQTRTPAV